MFLTFSNSILLIGLAGVVVPLVLHLLSRARYQSVDWGAMLFLEGTDSSQQHSTKLTQAILLLVRMGVVALLAVALAQPVLQQWGPEPDARGSALRAADHGQLLCLAGSVGCGALVLSLVPLLVTIRRGRGGRSIRLLCWLLMFVAAAGAAIFAQRAAAWGAEERRLSALQPQDPTAGPQEGALRARIDAAILLDCSASMAFEENGHTRFSLAQNAAKQVLAGLHRGDRAILVLLGRTQTEAELEPTSDLQSIADRIDSARLGQAPADVAEGLVKAQEVLDRNGRAARDIYIVSDRQALSWRSINDYFVTRRWPELLRRSSAAVRLFAVPVGNTDADNVAVEEVQLINPPAIVGQSADVSVQLRNYGSTPRAAVPFSVALDGRLIFESSLRLSPNHDARISVPIKGELLAAAGSHVLTAQVRTSGYRDDDRLDWVIDATPAIRVLVISGDQWDGAAGDFRTESDFLKLALAPLAALGRKGADPCKVNVISEEQWSQIQLQQYQVVILANVERFTFSQARMLEQYVYGGGGLLVAPGNLSRIEDYNEMLWREGSGILPAQLNYATSADGSEATTLVGYDPTSPVFAFLHDRPDLMLSATIGRYFPIDSRASDAQALAWYTSGSPFLVESRSGRGKLLLMTTSLDADWSTLPLSSLYLPFVQSAVRYLASGTVAQRNLVAGQPIHATLGPSEQSEPTMELPDGQTRPAPLRRGGDGMEVHWSDTTSAGVYRLRWQDRDGPHDMDFAVHASHEESDLTPISEKRWTELESGLHLKRLDPEERPIASVVASGRDGFDLWPWALAGVLLLVICEMGLARHWSRDAY